MTNLMNSIADSTEETSIQIIEQRTMRAEGTLRSIKRYYLNHKNEKILHGRQIKFFENGKKRSVTNYEPGNIDGVQIEYQYLDGINDIRRIGHWTDNKKTGKWIWFDPNGEKSAECLYKSGNIIGYKRFWDRGKLTHIEFSD